MHFYIRILSEEIENLCISLPYHGLKAQILRIVTTVSWAGEVRISTFYNRILCPGSSDPLHLHYRMLKPGWSDSIYFDGRIVWPGGPDPMYSYNRIRNSRR